MNNKIKKYIYISLLIFFIFILYPSYIKADYKDYEIKELNIDVDLLPNGDAYIKENWTINFIEGDFTRFYVSRLNNLPVIENFKGIEIDNVFIDGKLVDETYDIVDRPENTYSFYKQNDLYYYNWYFRANNEIKNLSINYIIKDVVKKDKNKAVFVYRFVGKNFEENIEKINIKINAPRYSVFLDENDLETYYLNYLNHKGLLKIKTNLSLDGFTNISTLTSIYFSKIKSTLIYLAPFIIILLFFIIYIVCMLPNNVIRRKLKNNPNLIYELENEFENISPVQLFQTVYKNTYKKSWTTLFEDETDAFPRL